jgi:hypothetical protein
MDVPKVWESQVWSFAFGPGGIRVCVLIGDQSAKRWVRYLRLANPPISTGDHGDHRERNKGTQSQNRIFDCRAGAGVARTSTKLFSGIATRDGQFVEGATPGGLCEGWVREEWGRSIGQSYFRLGVSGDLLVIFQEHAGSIDSAVFTWKNNGKLDVA